MYLCEAKGHFIGNTHGATSSNVFSLGTFMKMLQGTFHWEQFVPQLIIIGNTFVYKALCLNVINSLN